MDFILDFVDQKVHVVRTNGRGSCSLLDAADHLLLHPSDGLSVPFAAVQHKISESVVCEVHRFLYVSLLSFSLSPLLALSNLVVTSGCRPVVYPPSFLSSPGSPSPFPHPWTPTTAYKSQTPEVPPEAHHVPSLSNPHHHLLNPNRRENGRPTPYSLRSSNHIKSRMITFQRIATSIPTLQQWPTLPPTPAVPFPSLVRTCCFRPWGRVSSVRSNSVSICNGEKKSP